MVMSNIPYYVIEHGLNLPRQLPCIVLLKKALHASQEETP